MLQNAGKLAAAWMLALLIAAEAALAAAAVLFLLIEGQPRTALAALTAALFLALAALLVQRLGRRRDQQPPDAPSFSSASPSLGSPSVASPSVVSPSSLAAEAIRRHPAAAMTAAACAGLLLARNPELCRRLLGLGELMLRERLGNSRTDAGSKPS